MLDMEDEPLSTSSWPAAASDVRSRHRGALRTTSVHRLARSSRSNLGKLSAPARADVSDRGWKAASSIARGLLAEVAQEMSLSQLDGERSS